MGRNKNRHTKDRLFVTFTELQQSFGGKKDLLSIHQSQPTQLKLPFYCCSLSLKPFKDPVCLQDGTIFDVTNILPYIKKYKQNPLTGEPLSAVDLIKLHFHKNSQNEYHCPITFKLFTEHSHIVAIKTCGHVYSYTAIQELVFQNTSDLKNRVFKDLLTEQEFRYSDIIVLQDPMKNKNIQANQLKKQTLMNRQISQKEVKVEELDQKAERIKRKLLESTIQDPHKIHHSQENQTLAQKSIKHVAHTTGQAAAALTSTYFTPTTENELRSLSDNEINKLIYTKIKQNHQKGRVLISTSMGDIEIILHFDLVPFTCHNFIQLCEEGYYNGSKFFRNIPGFMIQGGHGNTNI